jgi:hypothetical protein
MNLGHRTDASGNYGAITFGGIDMLQINSSGLIVPAGLALQVNDPTAANHAVALKQVSLFPALPSAASLNIFGASGYAINLDNSTPVVTTSLVACTNAQVGSTKKVFPAQNWSITASANLIIDGATSGTYLMPAGANIEVFAMTNTQFMITTIFATGLWTPNQGSGLTISGTFSSLGKWTKRGNEASLHFVLYGTPSIACSSAGILFTNMPFMVEYIIGTSGHGTCTNAGDAFAAGIKAQNGTASAYCCTAVGASAQINGSVTYPV